MCDVTDCPQEDYYARGWCRTHYHKWFTHGDPLYVSKNRPKGLSLREAVEWYTWTEVEGPLDTPCWEWPGATRKEGHGYFRWGGKNVLVHRAAYEAWVGPIPEGQIVRHLCDNPPCYNPEHLRAGTHLDNFNDMISRGRERMFGEHHHNSVLNKDSVLEILGRYEGGETQTALAEEFGVGSSSIHKIVVGKSWKKVTGLT